MTEPPGDIRDAYEQQGYVFPLTAMTAAESAHYRAELERVERDFADHPYKESGLVYSPHLLLPFVDEITRLPAILDSVSQILGPDLLVWSVTLFVKEARSPAYVTWHQDLTYWGLDSLQEVTAWVALSPATLESGAMRFIPGSHRREIVPHRDTFAAENLLTRGQEIAVQVDEREAVDAVLRPGEISLHHGRLFHASPPNRSDDRRIGLAIRYISPDMRQVVGGKDFAVLVRGEDRFGHFEPMAPPKGDFDPGDVARVMAARALEEEYYYADASKAGRRQRVEEA